MFDQPGPTVGVLTDVDDINTGVSLPTDELDAFPLCGKKRSEDGRVVDIGEYAS